MKIRAKHPMGACFVTDDGKWSRSHRCYARGERLEVLTLFIEAVKQSEDWEPYTKERAAANPHWRAKAILLDGALFFLAGEVEVVAPGDSAIRERAWMAANDVARSWVDAVGEGIAAVSPEDNSITIRWRP